MKKTSNIEPHTNLDKCSIQISTHLAQYLKTWCKERGYTMSGFVEGAIIQRISGSYEK